ncbi:MAG: RES domain-containing protein [Rudaea sp.]|uniref:RES domain-containing protein n=1 Tax=Rudaea sp. TaxID=2136325 RepID=UPI0039E32C0F
MERFSDLGLQQWRHGWDLYRDLYAELYYGFEVQRIRHADELRDALHTTASRNLEIIDWGRIVDYRHSLSPLSVAGSVSTEGGRFNIGRRLDATSFTPFPALYIGENYPTAYAEKYSIRDDEKRDGLTADELVLRKPSSFNFVRVKGFLELYVDIGNVETLSAVAKVIAKFKMPERVLKIARSLKRAPPFKVASATALRTQLLMKQWNTLPIHFDLPSNSQIFGRLVNGAGFHGVLYPSARTKLGRCLALYPQNWKGSKSFISVADPAPKEATLVHIDHDTAIFE